MRDNVQCLVEDMNQLSLIEKKKEEKPYIYNASALDDEIREINYELSTPPSCAQKTRSYTTKHSYPEIEEELKTLITKGYSFITDSNKRPFKENKHDSFQYEIKRAIKLRFKCKNNRCPQFIKNHEEDVRKWTSYYGLVIFSFYFEKIPSKIPYKLRINLKIYGQKCFTCHQWGSGSIIEPDLLRLARLYSIIVEIVMHQRLKLLDNHDLEKGIKLELHETYGSAPKRRNKEVRMIGRVLGHKESLCQACSQGVCMSFYLRRENNTKTEDDQ